MVARITTALAIAMCDVAADAVDAGSGTAHLRVYSGTRPTNIGDALTTQVLLVEYDFPDPAFGNATGVTAGAQADSNITGQTKAGLATDTATFFQIIDGNGAVLIDGTVSNPAGSGDLKISSTAVTTGIDVEVVSLTLNVAKG